MTDSTKERYASLLNLADNWDGYGALANDPETNVFVQKFHEEYLSEITDDDVWIFPLVDGGVGLEIQISKSYGWSRSIALSFYVDGSIDFWVGLTDEEQTFSRNELPEVGRYVTKALLQGGFFGD